MARFKDYSYTQMTMLPVSFDQQILPGSFEYNLTYLIEECLDLTIFHHRYHNDDGGRPAYDPAILLKIVLLAYSKGITSSRKIEQLCRQNILFIAISANTQPHFTTIADFISTAHQEIEKLFLQVLMVCDAEGLIGKEMFAIDGCKLPSNASKEWSGTKADLKKKKLKMEKPVRRMLSKHREADKHGLDETIIERQKQQCRKLTKAAKKIQAFLDHPDERKGVSGRTVQSNITDNDSAKMKTSHGVIQGYTGVTTVDAKHQVIVSAAAHGQGQEHNLLTPSVEAAGKNLKLKPEARRAVKLTADSGYHNLAALQYLEQQKLDGYIADVGFRSRDPRFKDYARHKPATRLKPKERLTSSEFKVDIKRSTCICPTGNPMWLQCAQTRIGNGLFMKLQGNETDCRDCHLRKRCLRSEHQKTPRQFAVKLGNTREHQQTSLIEKMKHKIDSTRGRHIYSQRLGTVEPVFGNITSSIGFRRFSLRGKQKVNGQWRLISMIHNIFKIHRYAWNGA